MEQNHIPLALAVSEFELLKLNYINTLNLNWLNLSCKHQLYRKTFSENLLKQ